MPAGSSGSKTPSDPPTTVVDRARRSRASARASDRSRRARRTPRRARSAGSTTIWRTRAPPWWARWRCSSSTHGSGENTSATVGSTTVTAPSGRGRRTSRRDRGLGRGAGCGTGARRAGERDVPVGDRGRDELRLCGRVTADRDRERARRLADPAATARVDGEHLRVGHDDRDLVRSRRRARRPGPRRRGGRRPPVPGRSGCSSPAGRDGRLGVAAFAGSPARPRRSWTPPMRPADRGRVVGARPTVARTRRPHRHRLRPEVRRSDRLAGADLVGGDEDPGIALVLTQRREREHDARPPRR